MATSQLIDKLELSRTLIFNSRDAEVSHLLTKAGIDNEYIDEGESIYHEAIALCKVHKNGTDDLNEAFDQFFVDHEDAREDYEITLKMVTALSRGDRHLQNRLQLSNGRAFALDGWMQNAEDFYDRLLTETKFLAKLEKFNLTIKQLEEERETISSLSSLLNEISSFGDETTENTLLRKEKLEELQEYCFEFKEIAKIALGKRPQLMKKLGIVA